MAILEALGVLSTAQDLLAGATDSENVILLPAIDNLNWGEVWLDIECETIDSGGAADTYVFDLVLATESTLDTYRSICQISMVNGDPRIAAVNRKIACFEISKMIGDLTGTTYIYLGLISTLADVGGTAGVSINAAISPSKPRTKDDVQVVRSNVELPG